MDQVILDLGDFIPEEYQIAFSVNGHPYKFGYSEASVDEVLSLLWAADAPQDKDFIAKARRVVTKLLKSHVTEGDATTLEEDLKTVPYLNSRGDLSIKALFERIQGSVKKNPTDGDEKTTAQS